MHSLLFPSRREQFCSRVSRIVCLALLFLPGCYGCGGGTKSFNPKPYPIKATLTMDGKPIGPMMVMLYSTQPVNGPIIAGDVNDKGEVSFTTNRIGDGAPEGEYRFVIPVDPYGRDYQPVPEVYRQIYTTPITIKIEPKKNELTFNLDSQAKTPAQIEEEENAKNKRPFPKPRRPNVPETPQPPPRKVDPNLVK